MLDAGYGLGARVRGGGGVAPRQAPASLVRCRVVCSLSVRLGGAHRMAVELRPPFGSVIPLKLVACEEEKRLPCLLPFTGTFPGGLDPFCQSKSLFCSLFFSN